MPTTVFPSQVDRATKKFDSEVRINEYIERVIDKSIESCSDYTGRLLNAPTYHALVAASHIAFNEHRPLILSPDIIWITLTQGLANHINMNSEELRHHFVKHEGKEKIEVRRDDFIKGSPENAWKEVFPEFSAKIKEHIGEEFHSAIVADFSTTTNISRVASEIVLMDAMQSYFSFSVKTLCGIPEIRIEGEKEDWVRIRERIHQWTKWDLGWWTEHLDDILDKFIASFDGEDHPEFWESFYKINGGSGGPFVSGWINWLFPYLWKMYPNKRYEKNPFVGRESFELSFSGPTEDHFPSALSRVPFVWNYYGTHYPYEFVAGLVGIKQEEDLALRPEIGWAVAAGEIK
jgi:hypothetical protein